MSRYRLHVASPSPHVAGYAQPWDRVLWTMWFDHATRADAAYLGEALLKTGVASAVLVEEIKDEDA